MIKQSVCKGCRRPYPTEVVSGNHEALPVGTLWSVLSHSGKNGVILDRVEVSTPQVDDDDEVTVLLDDLDIDGEVTPVSEVELR